MLQNRSVVIDGEFLLSILRDIVQAMLFLHESSPPIIHGNLKSASVYIDHANKAKIKYLGHNLTKCEGSPSSMAFLSPELLTSGRPTKESDVYAFGILLYELCSRKDPYDNEDICEICKEVVSANRRPPVSPDWPLILRFLMTTCWKHNPCERLQFHDIFVTLRNDGRSLLDSLQSDLQQSEQNFRRAFEALKDIFPLHIADALAHGRPVESLQRDSVTIFFSDIVGYTAISSDLDGNKVVDMLNRLYQKFDHISEELGVIKIDTIGEVYLLNSS